MRGAQSWSFSLPVAIIWSAKPGDFLRGVKPSFTSTSTVHIGTASAKNPLVLAVESHASFAEILASLKFRKKGGITEEEAVRVLNYLHNRLSGRAKGGEFAYRVYDEDGEPRDERDLPLSFTNPATLISNFRDDWEVYDDNDQIDYAENLVADSYIFADAPRVQEAAKRLGHDALIYEDVFQGGTTAAEVLLGTDVDDLEGIEQGLDLEEEFVPMHQTYRPLVDSAVSNLRAISTEQALAMWQASMKKGLTRGRARPSARRRRAKR